MRVCLRVCLFACVSVLVSGFHKEVANGFEVVVVGTCACFLVGAVMHRITEIWVTYCEVSNIGVVAEGRHCIQSLNLKREEGRMSTINH